MDALAKLTEEAKALKGTIIFAEGDEERTIEAAVNLKKDGICEVVALAPTIEAMRTLAAKKGLDISNIKLLAPSLDLLDKAILTKFLEGRKNKGLTDEQSQAAALSPLNFAALYVKSGKATGTVMGARASTPDVLRAAIGGIGAAPGMKLISSFFLMVPPAGHPVIKEPVIYADCGVNPDPSTLGLRDIALASVRSFKSLFPGRPAKAAFLSFSTKGSAQHPVLKKVLDAVASTQEHFKDDTGVSVDGELQFDAAVIPQIAQRKSPGSKIQGDANIFIFPDLNSGNICYKVTERLGGFTALGPIIQGVAAPINDLSRGCSVRDIYYVAVVTLLQSR